MSRPEDKREIKLTEGPTALTIAPEGVQIGHGGRFLTFVSLEDFMQFMNNASILSVKLDQALNPIPEDETPPEGDGGTGA